MDAPHAAPPVVFSRFPLAPFADEKLEPIVAVEPAQGAASAFVDPELTAIAPFVDRAFYWDSYPDVAADGADPVAHYHAHGWREGRNPNPWFDSQYYLDTHHDVRAAGIDPLAHYAAIGRQEARRIAAPGGALRRQVDRAVPPSRQTAGYDAPDDAPFLIPASLRDAVAAAGLGKRGWVVAVSHDRYFDTPGGIQICIADEQALFQGAGCAYLHVSPVVARFTLDAERTAPCLLQLVLDGRFLGLATAETLEEILAELPRSHPARLFIVHSAFGHRISVLIALARALQPRHSVFWVHDYAAACEGYNLLRDDAVFCGAPPPDSMACRVCVYGERRQTYRAAMRGLFEAVAFDVVAPSRMALDLWLKSTDLPHRSARIHANLLLRPATACAAEPGPVRVAFIGHPAPNKGWPVFLDLLYRARGLPEYEFYQFASPASLRRMHGLTGVAAEVDRHDRFAMAEALAVAGIDLVLMLSPWPETFSYVAYEALAAGADIIALAVTGNVVDTIRRLDRGVVLRDADALQRFFLDLSAAGYARDARAAGRRRGRLLPCGTSATLDLAAPFGPDPERLLTEEPDLRVIAGDSVLDATRDGLSWHFTLPEHVLQVRLLSRSMVPVMLGPSMPDHRRLGIAVAELTLDGDPVPPDDPRRRRGWHSTDQPSQWTCGDAVLTVGGARHLAITLAPGASYLRCPLVEPG